MIEPEYTASPGSRVAGSDSPVRADWSTSTGSPSSSRASAGTMSPSRSRITSPGTRSRAAGVTHCPSRLTRAVIAAASLLRGDPVLTTLQFALVLTVAAIPVACLLYTSDAADEEDSVDLGGR